MSTMNRVKALAAALAVVSTLASSQSMANPACAAMPSRGDNYVVPQGSQQDVRYAVKIDRIAIGDPEVADVQVSSNSAFVITGKKAGQTSLLVWTSCSAEPLRSMVNVESALVGNIRTARTADKTKPQKSISEIPSQVQADIRFVEVSRTKLQEASSSIYGVRNSRNHMFGAPNTLPSAQLGATPPASAKGAIPLVQEGFNIVWGGGSDRVLGILNLLENSGFAYTLAQPSLVALSGQSANFLAGGEFPIPVPQSGNNSAITIEYKQFGILLTLTPTVVAEDQILLKVAPEVSELDFSAGIQVNGISVPALRVRRTDTSIAMADGESFVISGLISKNTVSSVDKMPWLGDIPILGAFFRSSRLDAEDRELLMVVTPRLVKPLAKNAQVPKLPGDAIKKYDPNFFDFFFTENGRYDRRRSESSGFSN